MICEICNKNPATIHIQEIINGQKKVLHICAECAAKKSAENPLLQGFNVAEMLYNLSGQFGLGAFQPAPQEPSEIDLVCPGCGWHSEDLKRTGKLGCQECYKTFREVLDKALKNMHRGMLHVGKAPAAMGDANSENRRMAELMRLQQELEELVGREEYEKAAVVRDKINRLKKELQQ
ncbi:MAG: UvrB/UvrC motif-containing protein [Victivallales bacterium]|nr:UvrB/UvrC motif-containing protein [Victivallales bacterium]